MASASTLSPASSPRLPSPPPMAEDQTGPQSPKPTSNDEPPGILYNPADLDYNASRRVRPGTKAAEIPDGPPMMELADIDSPFQLTEHLKALHHHYTHTQPPESPRSVALTRHSADLMATCPPGVDRPLWLYELCRFLVLKANIFVNGLFSDTPPCSAATCHEMRASEWQYLCAVHDPPKSCCAIDYCCHTLDWAANTLTSPRHFPSRLTLEAGKDGAGSGPGSGSQMRQLTNIFRRVYRIFAHAWFQHREVFWRVEGRTGLYCLFKTVCDAYQLIPEDNYTIPPEAEGLEEEEIQDRTNTSASQIKVHSSENQRPLSMVKRDDSVISLSVPPADPNPAPGATARRHKHNPSKGQPVDTVPEENEDDDANKPPTSSKTALENSETEPDTDDSTMPPASIVQKDAVETDMQFSPNLNHLSSTPVTADITQNAAEGIQATATDAADASSASKTVED